MTSNIIAASAFWNNDKDWGFGASLIKADMSHEQFDTFVREVEALGENLHHQTDMTVDEANVQLRHFVGAYKQTTSYAEQLSLLVLMFGNVKFLTLKGAIDPSDEFNGLQYMHQITNQGTRS